MASDHEVLRKRYEDIARSGDPNTTACDYNLRELEIEFALQYIRDGDRILDVGCGPGVALSAYATQRNTEAHGIDYAENMIAFARQHAAAAAPGGNIVLQQANVLELPYEDDHFDVVTSSRCLMALLDWELQQKALLEIRRVLKPNGTLVLMEGTAEGIDRLNAYRRRFGLSEIAADGRDRLYTLKFSEKNLLAFCEPHYALERVQRFGMYYFLTRIVQPLLVAPAQPSYDHPLNAVARQIARAVPDFDGMGHLVAFVFRKRRG
jgi:ubiquinone/menaquinone biosynthesis C-methylase UbiE